METPTADTKQWRKELDETLQKIKDASTMNGKDVCDCKNVRSSRERSLAITKIQEAIMWLGMDLKDIGESSNPYPHSYDPASPVIDPTADGLKL